MKSYSQAGQDLWVLSKLPDGRRLSGESRTFLEIGCAHPTELSNTKALEENGWRGWQVDNDHNAVELCRCERPGSFAVVEADATKVCFDFMSHKDVDYLSLDIDHGTLDALRNVLRQGITFQVATVEHDAYRFGDELRVEERRLLLAAGYVLDRADVESQGCPFEDFWVVPALATAQPSPTEGGR